jgi:hypothetical protein
MSLPCPDCAALRREIELWEKAHMREHEQHGDFHDREHASTQKGIDKAEATLGIRLESMNAIREQLRDQQSNLMTREVAEVQHRTIGARLDHQSERLDAMDNWRAGVEGRTLGIAAAVGAIVVGINVALHFI